MGKRSAKFGGSDGWYDMAGSAYPPAGSCVRHHGGKQHTCAGRRTGVGGDTGAMTRDEVLAFCLSLSGAEETYPFGEEVAVIKVGGKMFALVLLSGGPGSVNLKCDPAQALELREAYPGIRPGYHQNKRHWNTVDLDGSVEDDVVRGLISDSYNLVVAGLPRSSTELAPE
jgi:predicted DNA-binding protein (MmcQ/YjbR family)